MGGARAQGGARLASPGSAGSLELEKVDGGFGRRPVSRAPQRSLPGGDGPGCPGKGVCAPVLAPWVFSGPCVLPYPLPQMLRGLSACALPGYGARLPTAPARAQRAGGFSAHRRLRGTSCKPGCPLPCRVCVFETLHRFLPSVVLRSGRWPCVCEHPSWVLSWLWLLTVGSRVVHPG